MKIAILHYHLKPGGVTTVLRHQIRALQGDANLLVISGEKPPPGFPCEVAYVNGVGYTSGPVPERSPARIVDDILQSIHRHFGAPCDVLHIHNPLLAKNQYFLDILQLLQDAGLTLFLQIHDFAEDGRPAVCYPNVPYPKDCHYGVINTRDYHILIQAGLAREGLHYLPNCIVPFEGGSTSGRQRYILYPVRAIRRKNVGEVLLLSLFIPADQSIYITQPPNSPADFEIYNDWKAIAKTYRLAVRFEMGRHHPYPDLVAGADSVLTTSIGEGFGFAFLEPWTAGKGLKGRLLADICQDFSRAGIRLEHLYTGLQLPKEWLGNQRVLNRFAACLEFNRRAFGALWPETWSASCLKSIRQSDCIDFGLLDEPFQRECLELISRDTNRRREMLERNQTLISMMDDGPTAEVIHHNRERIVSLYHPDRYREKLIAIYREILDKPVRHAIDRRILLTAFLKENNFSLLKWGGLP